MPLALAHKAQAAMLYIAIFSNGNHQRLQHGTQPLGHRHRTARGAVHINMDEMPGGGAQRLALGKQPHLITHTGAPQPRHTDARLHRLRKRQRSKIIALGFDHQANGFTGVDIQHALLYQVGVDGRVEPAVIHDIVHMAVDIIVGPAGLYIGEVSVIPSFHWYRSTFLTHWHTSELTIFDHKFKPS